MNKKERKRFTVNIPQYMWEIITRIHDESPSITENGTMLTILEKGINWYQKKWKDEKKKAETATPGNESAQPDQHQDLPNQDAPVDHETIYSQILQEARRIQAENKEDGYYQAISYLDTMRASGQITSGETQLINNILIAHIKWANHS